MPRCLAAHSHSMAPEWLAPRWLTLDCHQSCYAALPCSRGREDCSVTSLKNCVAPLRPISTLQLTGTPCIGQPLAMILRNNVSPTYPTSAMCADCARRRNLWQTLSLFSPLPTIPFFTAQALLPRKAGPISRPRGYARLRPPVARLNGP